MCNSINGGCHQGCEPGWRANTCKDTCEEGNYGEDCSRVCGNCFEERTCNHRTGICTNGCAAGFKGVHCYQMCSPGKYGTNCNQTCGHCNVSDCDSETGMCSQGCMPGWNGSYCNMSCPAGYHGIDCQQHCGHCRDAETCNYVSGACTSCATGYRGATCSETCEEGSYGDNCTGTCGNCFEGNCIHTTGICINGCQAGFEGDLCNSECPSGKFGANCVQHCGYCMDLTECNKVTGFCTGSCSPGWIGSYCNESCMGGKYGQNCTDVCGNCSGEGTCNHTTGICTNGCISGFKGGLCKETCSPGEFGMNCSQSCGYCNDSIECSKETGFCSGSCLPGWVGSYCNESCKNGTYGENCTRLCGNCSEIGDCNHETGICAAGCVAGFQGKHCNTTCSAGTFGTNCAQNCGKCNSSTECNKETGHCSDSCKPGWNTSFCNESCAEGYFGFECKQLCGNCGDGEYCNPISGVCKSCDADYTGETCKQIKLKDSPPESSQAGTIAGVIVTVLVACGIGVAAVFVIRRRRSMGSKFRGSEMEHRIEFHNATVIADEMPDTEQSEDTVYKNAAIINSYIDVGDLRDVCATAKRNPQPFYNDFETLPYGLKKDASEARDPKYKSKNRYKEMYPYNANRVHLPMIPGDELSTYINASYINGYDIPQKYIAAQGALKTTISDVWRMVWTKTVSTIVMLTNCVELGKLKCAKYWPDDEAEAEVHDDISVVLEKSDLFSDFIIRTFLCTKVSSGEKRTVVQFHYTAWPDKDVPDTSLSLVQFWRAVRYNQSSKALPWLVHCSAGVGRTGTFIALDFLYDMGTLLGTVNILDAVNTLREQRLNMVQTKEQYVYVHEIAAEVLIPIGSVCQNDDFDELFQSLVSVDGRATEKLKKEFEDINNYELEPDDEQDGIYSNITQSQSADAKLKENIGKSRDLKMIPKDLYRPQLSMVVIGRNDFINAVYVPTCRNRSELILTQIPLEHTVVDFLRLIWEYNVSIVVLLEEHMAEECSYYPSTTTLKQVDVFTTELRNEKKEECYVLRTIVISLKGRSEQRELKQFQIRSWPKDKPTPIDTGSMLKLISDIDNDGVSRGCAPIVVQCLDGAKKSGVFSTLWCLLVRQKSNNEIAVAETVRMSRVRRKQIIDNFEQYKYCYNVMRDYLDSFSVYANAI